MKKNYRLTIDIEVDINEKVEIPQDPEDNSSAGEYTPEMVKRTQHILDAFAGNPTALNDYLKLRLYWHYLDFDMLEKILSELIGVKDEAEIATSLIHNVPPETVPYLLGVFCSSSNYPGPDKDDAAFRYLIISQFSNFNPFRASIVEIEKDIRLQIPGEERCVRDCILARGLRDFLLKEVKYA